MITFKKKEVPMARYLLIVCLVLFSSFSLSQALTVKKEFQQSYDLNSGGELTIKNVNGKIQIDSWDKNKVELFAEIKVKAGNKRAAEKFMEKVEIKVKSIKDQLDISVEHPKKKDNESFFNLLFGNKKPNLSVQFFFKVPHECNLTASSVNGSVEVTGVSATADLQTVNGKINAENIQGAVDASTTNGSIYVEIAKTDNTENMKFKTVNGSVKVFLPKRHLCRPGGFDCKWQHYHRFSGYSTRQVGA